MRLGTVPVWDLLMQGYRCITLCVSNAFRHGPGLGLFALALVVGGYSQQVSNAFRHGPGLGPSSPKRDFPKSRRLQCLSARSRFGTEEENREHR